MLQSHDLDETIKSNKQKHVFSCYCNTLSHFTTLALFSVLASDGVLSQFTMFGLDKSKCCWDTSSLPVYSQFPLAVMFKCF